MPSTTVTEPLGRVDPEQAARLDGFVERAQGAAREFRAPRPGGRRPDRLGDGRRRPRAAPSIWPSSRWRRPASACFEDKVVKNYVATEFLYDYLKDKRSVGVIDEDPERAHPVRRRADRRRAGAAADHQPDLDGAVQVDRGREDAQRDDLPALGARRALRASARWRSSRRPARPPACRRTRSRWSPTRRSTSPSTSSTTRASTSSGPPAGRRPSPATNEAGKPCLGVGPGNAPVYVHRSADVQMAVVDILISKTFDASVICPAEQTVRRSTTRSTTRWWPSSSGWARACSTADEVERSRRRVLHAGRAVSSIAALGQSCANLGRDGRVRRTTGRQGPARAAALGPRRARAPSAHRRRS